MELQKKHFYFKITQFKNDIELGNFFKSLTIWSEIKQEIKNNSETESFINNINKNLVWVKVFNEGLVQLLFEYKKKFIVIKINDFENNTIKIEYIKRTLINLMRVK